MTRTRWSPWRSVLAGAVIGFVEAAGSKNERGLLRYPDPIIRFVERERDRPALPRGLWFLAPLRDIRRYLSPN